MNTKALSKLLHIKLPNKPLTPNYKRKDLNAYNGKRLQQLLKKESQRYNRARQHWCQLSKYLFQRNLSRRSKHSESPILNINGNEYVSRMEYFENKQNQILYKLENNKQRQILNIMNIGFLKEFKKNMRLIDIQFSECHNYLLFGIDLNNDQIITYYLKDIKNNQINKKSIPNCYKAIFTSNQTILYIKQQNMRPSKLVKVDLDLQTNIKQLYHQTNQAYFLNIYKATNPTYSILTSQSKQQSYTFILNHHQLSLKSITHPNIQKHIICDIHQNIITYVDLLSNKIFSAQLNKTNQFSQKCLINESSTINSVQFLINYIVLFYTYINKAHVAIIKRSNYDVRSIQYESPSYISKIQSKNIYANQITFFKDTPFSFQQYYSLNLQTASSRKIRKMQLQGPKFNFNKYITITLFAPTRDGQQVPITMLKPRHFYPKNRTSKLILHSYGCYGQCLEPTFDLSMLAALQQQFIIVYVHIRGGRQKGQKWYKQAKQDRLKSIYDLEDSISYLVSQGYCNPARIAMWGSSAGSIPIMGLINRKPRLAKAIYLYKPFLNVLQTLLNPQLPLTKADHKQFGDPSKSLLNFQNIQKICPKQMLRHVQYPAIMIRSGSKDFRCPASGALSFLQRFRQVAKQPNRIQNLDQKNIFLSIGQQGHEGGTESFSKLQQACEAVAFIQWALTKGNKQLLIS